MPAVIFDMDGVLIDSEPLWHRAEVEVFGAVGVPLTAEMCLETMGLRVDALVNYWFERHPWAAPSKAEVAQRVTARVSELVTLHGDASGGAVELVSSLKAAGVPLALCSSSPFSLIEAVCAKLRILSSFLVLQSADECVHGKPHPDPYLATATKLGLDPARCIVIEDSLNGMRSARAAGMRVIGVSTNPAASTEGLCDLVVDSMGALAPARVHELLKETRQGASTS